MPLRLSLNNYLSVESELRTSMPKIVDFQLKDKLQVTIDEMESIMAIFHDRYAYADDPAKIKELNRIFENSQRVLQEAKDYLLNQTSYITMSEIDPA